MFGLQHRRRFVLGTSSVRKSTFGITSSRSWKTISASMGVELQRRFSGILGTNSAVYFGGATGGDTILLNFVGVLRGRLISRGARDQDLAKLVVVCPDVAEALPRDSREAVKWYAHDVVELRNSYEEFGDRTYHIRNDKLVELSTQMAAYWDGVSAGTKSTIESARRADVPINVYMVR